MDLKSEIFADDGSRSLSAQVGDTLALEDLPTGLTCVVEAPLRAFQGEN